MDTVETILKRRSIRRYKREPIPEEDLRKILECGRQAPSAANRQPWHFIVTREPDLKAKLAEACNGQMWIADADVILTAVGLPSVNQKWYQVDVAIAMQNMILAATSLGYGTCWIGAFQKDKVKELLGIPEDMDVIALTPIGVPDQSPGPRSRKSPEEVFSKERYGGGAVY
ncbi:TPA: nitroreductase [Candidatus Poribacteria bacterium]|nr:nitroreductase [Candidatus Poribacteria bacterium]